VTPAISKSELHIALQQQQHQQQHDARTTVAEATYMSHVVSQLIAMSVRKVNSSFHSFVPCQLFTINF